MLAAPWGTSMPAFTRQGMGRQQGDREPPSTDGLFLTSSSVRSSLGSLWASSEACGFNEVGLPTARLQLFSVQRKDVSMAALEFPVLFHVHNSIMTHGETGSFLIVFFSKKAK